MPVTANRLGERFVQRVQRGGRNSGASVANGEFHPCRPRFASHDLDESPVREFQGICSEIEQHPTERKRLTLPMILRRRQESKGEAFFFRHRTNDIPDGFQDIRDPQWSDGIVGQPVAARANSITSLAIPLNPNAAL